MDILADGVHINRPTGIDRLTSFEVQSCLRQNLTSAPWDPDEPFADIDPDDMPTEDWFPDDADADDVDSDSDSDKPQGFQGVKEFGSVTPSRRKLSPPGSIAIDDDKAEIHTEPNRPQEQIMRILSLLDFLASRRVPVTLKQIIREMTEEHGVCCRTVRRDFAILKRAGLLVEHDALLNGESRHQLRYLVSDYRSINQRIRGTSSRPRF